MGNLPKATLASLPPRPILAVAALAGRAPPAKCRRGPPRPSHPYRYDTGWLYSTSCQRPGGGSRAP
eukprot:678969-Pyramimonas_sp.AAC.1